MNRKRLLKKLALSAGTLLVLGIAGELVTRALEPGPFALLDTYPYVPHEGSLHRHKPNFAGRWDGTWYETNARGLRGPEVQPEFTEGEFRVVCLGDSCTFGKGVREEDSWPRQLEGLLAAEAGGSWRPLVANLGHNGYSGRAYEIAFRELGLDLKPDLVVVGYNLNDFPNAIRAVDEEVFRRRGLRTALPTGLRDFAGRFALYRFARQTYYHLNRAKDWKNAESFAKGAAGGGEADAAVWAQQRAYLEQIKAHAAKSGAKLAVFLFPYESQVYLETFETAPIERLEELCHELEVPFVDLATEFRRVARAESPPKQLFLRGDRYHPDPEGYRIVAEAVLRTVKDKNWLPD